MSVCGAADSVGRPARGSMRFVRVLLPRSPAHPSDALARGGRELRWADEKCTARCDARRVRPGGATQVPDHPSLHEPRECHRDLPPPRAPARRRAAGLRPGPCRLCAAREAARAARQTLAPGDTRRMLPVRVWSSAGRKREQQLRWH